MNPNEFITTSSTELTDVALREKINSLTSEQTYVHYDLNAMAERTGEINELVGNKAHGGWKDIEHQGLIVFEEMLETLFAGITSRNAIEFRDGIGDILFTVFGLGHRAGVPVAEDFANVVASNMLKFDTSVTDVNLTKAKYDKLGVPTHYVTKHSGGVTYFITLVSADTVGSDDKHYRQGKWLKSHRWSEPTYRFDHSINPVLTSTADAGTHHQTHALHYLKAVRDAFDKAIAKAEAGVNAS